MGSGGPPNNVGQGGTPDYWGKKWIGAAQDAIGDHKTPMFFDGSLGGTARIPGNLAAQTRIDIGGNTGYVLGKSIIEKLDKGETIKIVTNSMGAAFERGFTQGLLAYRDERLGQVNAELLVSGIEMTNLERIIGKENLVGLGAVREAKTEAEKNMLACYLKCLN